MESRLTLHIEFIKFEDSEGAQLRTVCSAKALPKSSVTCV